MSYEASLRILQAMPREAKALLMAADESNIVDALGEIREVEKGVASERKLGASEVEPGQVGQDWMLKQSKVATRTFNHANIIKKFADARDTSMLAALAYLISNDAVRLNWQISKLKPLIRIDNITIETAQHEITEGDSADIGEVWGLGYPTYERRSE
jgi:hypothetical protein